MVCSGSPLKTKELKFHQQLSKGNKKHMTGTDAARCDSTPFVATCSTPQKPPQSLLQDTALQLISASLEMLG